MDIYKPRVIMETPNDIGRMIVMVCNELVSWSRPVGNEVALMIGTCAVESDFCYRRQLGGGPARGIFQVEPATAEDIFRTYLLIFTNSDSRIALRRRTARLWLNMHDLCPYAPDEETISWHLENNDVFCCIMARLKYMRDPAPIPVDVSGQAAYWKRVYNTSAGAGKIVDYLAAWEHVGKQVYEAMTGE